MNNNNKTPNIPNWDGLYSKVCRGRRSAKKTKKYPGKDNYTVRLVETSPVQKQKESKGREIGSVMRRNKLKFSIGWSHGKGNFEQKNPWY